MHKHAVKTTVFFPFHTFFGWVGDEGGNFKEVVSFALHLLLPVGDNKNRGPERVEAPGQPDVKSFANIS